MKKLFLITMGLLTSTMLSANAIAKIKYSDAQICRQLLRVKPPQGIQAEECYDQAKKYLKSKNIKIMTGSYQAYFALSGKDPSQGNCRPFLKNMVMATQQAEFDDAKEIFGDDKAYSLDRSYYSYQTCREMKFAKSQSPVKKAKKAKFRFQKSAQKALSITSQTVEPVQSQTVQTQSTPTQIQHQTPSSQPTYLQGVP